MTKVYRYSKTSQYVIVTDSKNDAYMEIIPFDHSDPLTKSNEEYQKIISMLDNGDISILPYEAVDIVPQNVDKIWFIRALRKQNLKDSFDSAFDKFDDDLKEDYSLINAIDRNDIIIDKWKELSKVSDKDIDKVFTYAETLKRG